MPASRIIHDLPGWQITSYGNGLVYEVLNLGCRASLFFQGDDAEQFRTEFDALTSGTVQFSFADALRCIWSDYSDVAQAWEKEA